MKRLADDQATRLRHAKAALRAERHERKVYEEGRENAWREVSRKVAEIRELKESRDRVTVALIRTENRLVTWTLGAGLGGLLAGGILAWAVMR
jgi:ribosomal protein S8E